MSDTTVTISFIIAVLLTGILLYLIVRDILLHKTRFFEFKKDIPTSIERYFAVGSFIWLLSLWYVVSYSGLINSRFVPLPHEVAKAFFELFNNQSILLDIWASVRMIFTGFLLAASLGTLLGLLAGSFKRFYAIIIPPNSFIRYIPPTAFISLFILWFGIGEGSKISLIFAGIFFFIVQMVTDATRNVAKEYLEVAYTLGANRWTIFWNVVVRAALPDIVLAWRINIAAAWTFLVVAELIAAQQGLGHLIAVSQRFLNTPQLFSAILLIGFIGLIIDFSFEGLMRIWFPWRRAYA